MISQQNRREFLKFLGYGSLSLTQLNLLSSCSPKGKFPTFEDDVILKDGLSYYRIISFGDKINEKEIFGFNNDYINILSTSKDKLIMWVNHEYIHPLFVSSMDRTRENVDIEKKLVGGSLIELNKKGSNWILNPESEYNKGVRGDTKISFANDVSVKGSKVVEGTLANCAGGKTPWGTFLTCEENYDSFYGERNEKDGSLDTTRSRFDWWKFYPNNLPEHYGWVVEVEPKTGKAKKHTNLGRFAHESATPIVSKSNKVVVYSGDDKNDEHLYKFISTSNDNFDEGTLYVANIEKKKWLPLDLEKSPILKKHFSTQIDVVTYARKASKILGATPLNRPEDIEIHPQTGEVFIALTNNKKRGDMHGSILKISEKDNDHASTEFSASTFLFGGEESGLSCPDNLAFDSKGNLWISTDISGSAMGKAPYKSFGNNGIFVVEVSGVNAGIPIQIASAPKDAEFTGLCFDPEEKNLFVSVQHPGEKSKDLNSLTSHWPTGKIPKPSVIAIHGELLNKITKA